jgi:hypothetical protein
MRDLSGLSRYRFEKKFRAGDGEAGRNELQHGANGADIVLPVPVGTVVSITGRDEKHEIVKEGESVILFRGGTGGRGNATFKSSTNQNPFQQTDGKEGREFPIAIGCPGKVFRNEATDATHEAQFYQIEGFYVGKDTSLAMMVGVMQKLFSEFFETDIVIRLRSSYFPFVEPGNEFDMQCFKCKGSGCNICKQTGWIEIGGAGMVHPKVLEAGGINPKEYRGFAFGCGIDRMVMLKYGIDDIRLLYNGDLRVVNQF